MSLRFSISANFARCFMGILGFACRSSDAVLLLPGEDALELFSVHPDQTSHLRIAIPRAHLEGYDYRPPPSEGGGLVLCLLARALRATALRQPAGAVQRVELRYAGAGALRWTSTLASGAVKRFALLLAAPRGAPRVAADPAAYHFELSAAAKVLGGLLCSLSPTATTCVVSPMDGRLEIRRVAADAPEAKREGGAAVVVSASPQAFLSFRYFSHAPGAGEPAFVALPSKLLDSKPLQRAAYFAGQLGFPVQIRLGGGGCPVHVRAPPAGPPSDDPAAPRVEFDLYLAALDVWPPSEGGGGEEEKGGGPSPTPRAALPDEGLGEAPPPSPDEGERGPQRSRLSDLYPLDYAAFTSARAAEGGEGLDDPIGAFFDAADDDDDLQRFLQNCTPTLAEDAMEGGGYNLS